MAFSKVKTSGIACSALGSSANTATPPRSPTKRLTVIAISTTIFRPILASFHHKCLSARIRPHPACISLDTAVNKLVESASLHALSAHSREPPVMVSNRRGSNKAMLPSGSMALPERDGSRLLRTDGDLFPNFIHRRLGDPGFCNELLDRFVGAVLDQLVGILFVQSQGQGQVSRSGLVDVHEVRRCLRILIGGGSGRRRGRRRCLTRSG